MDMSYKSDLIISISFYPIPPSKFKLLAVLNVLLGEDPRTQDEGLALVSRSDLVSGLQAVQTGLGFYLFVFAEFCGCSFCCGVCVFFFEEGVDFFVPLDVPGKYASVP